MAQNPQFLKVYSCPVIDVLKGARDVQLKLPICRYRRCD
jgi:hypothetical protein